MNLANLAYECVKDSITQPSDSIDFYGFISGSKDNDSDFVSQISSVMAGINEAMARLASWNKIPLITEEVVPNGTRILFSKGDIINVVDKTTLGYSRIPFRTIKYASEYEMQTEGQYSSVFVEYRPSIPHFTFDSFRESYLNEDKEEAFREIPVDLLALYGITDQMCDYIKEYVKGIMLEYISSDMSAAHVSRAEQYFSQIPCQQSSFFQTHVAGGWRYE